jgi:hypothetical protein
MFRRSILPAMQTSSSSKETGGWRRPEVLLLMAAFR